MQAATPAPLDLRRGHHVVATVSEPDVGRIVDILRALPPDVTIAEVRLDRIWPRAPDADAAADQLLRLTDATHVPLLATLRPRRQRGAFEGAEEVRLGLLVAAARAGFAAVDLEADLQDTVAVRRELPPGTQVVLSHHAATTPSREDGLRLLQRMQDEEGGLEKLAVPCGSFADSLRILELVHTHAARGGRPSVQNIGHGGAALRALAALAGNHATYGHAPGSPAAVSGQPGIRDVARIWDHWDLMADDLAERAGHPGPWYAVLGTPVDHSLSPALHNAALRKAGRHERYGALEVPASSSALRLTCMVAARIGLAGASVTAPHKQDAARMGTNDAVAAAVGAANCLRFRGERLDATNTDATALRRLLGDHVAPGGSAVVLGAGGAASAALWALRELGADVQVASRDAARGTAVAQRFGAAWAPWERRGSLRADVWVQATPIGSQSTDASPLSAAQLETRPVVVDVVYAAGETWLVRAARAAGCAVVDGKTVLFEQAVDAFRFWFDQAPDARAMREALA